MSRMTRWNSSYIPITLPSLMKGENLTANFSSSTVRQLSSGLWKLYMKYSLVSLWKALSIRICFSRPSPATWSAHFFRSATFRWKASRISMTYRSQKNSSSLPGSSSSMALVQLPPESRAILTASSSPSPRLSISASMTSSCAMPLTSNLCTRLLMVSSSRSGRSLAMMMCVSAGGSSMSFSSLLAHSRFIFSGSQMMQIFFPPWFDFMESMRVMRSLSPTGMMLCWFSTLMLASQSCKVKYTPLLISISFQSAIQSSLEKGFSAEAFLGRMTGKVKCRSGCCHLAIMAHEGQCPQESSCFVSSVANIPPSSFFPVQRRQDARARASAIFPEPCGPQSIMACGSLLLSARLRKRAAISFCPIISLNFILVFTQFVAKLQKKLHSR